MQLKKWGILVLCSLTIVSFAGCTPKEEEPEPPQIEIEEPEEELSREIKKDEQEWRGYSNEELEELYPELEKIKEYLFEKYKDVLVIEAQETYKTNKEIKDRIAPISYGYWGGGGVSHKWE